jgi:hypothetical protein
MTPKEKAEELVNKFQNSIEYVYLPESISIQCALIAVKECLHTCVESMIYYWQEVKHELENL